MRARLPRAPRLACHAGLPVSVVSNCLSRAHGGPRSRGRDILMRCSTPGVHPMIYANQTHM
eukprot:scaffold7465_cov390-Prasinococcus_capsulatus_cf.AAC.1